jgi:hypothetical protein
MRNSCDERIVLPFSNIIYRPFSGIMTGTRPLIIRSFTIVFEIMYSEGHAELLQETSSEIRLGIISNNNGDLINFMIRMSE